MKHSFLTALFVSLMFGLAGCVATPPALPTGAPAVIASITPESIPTVQPKAVTIAYKYNAQTELISPSGTRILIDVFNPSALSNPTNEKDILLTTHTHSDHVNHDFYSNFKGQQLFVKVGEIKTADVTIRSIASAHNEGDPLEAEGGSDYIFIIDIGGLRIAHFGDIGQDALTADQLTALGKVDIAISQFDNSFSSMNADNKKGFNLMDQLKPRLIIPTHISVDTMKYAKTKWPCLYSEKPLVKISRKTLTDETQLLFLGNSAASYGRITDAANVDW